MEKARAFYQAYDAAVDRVESIVRQENIACDFARVGKLKLAAKPEHYDKLARACDVLRREVDPQVEMVPAASIRSEVGSASFHGGLLPHRRNYVTSRNIGNYFRISADNRLVFGGRARFAMSNPRSDQKSGRILRAAMEDFFPALREVRIDAWYRFQDWLH